MRDSTWPLVVLLLLAVAAVTVAVVRRRDTEPGAGTAYAGVVAGTTAARGAHGATSDAGAPSGRFRPGGRLTGGYRRDEVDAFFARIESGGVSAREVEDVRFGSARGHGSYDEEEVDEALDRAAARLRGAG